MPRVRQILRSIALLLFVSFFLTLNPSSAQALSNSESPTSLSASDSSNLNFTSFIADYYLTKTDTGVSKLRIKEILTIDFQEPHKNNSVIRIIPRTNQNGANKIVDGESSLNLTVTRNGMPETVSQIIEGQDNYTAYIGDSDQSLEGTQVYTLEYDFSDVVTEFNAAGDNVSGASENEAWQEFSWDLSLDDWRQSFNLVQVNLHFPEDVFNNLKGEPLCIVSSPDTTPDPSRCIVSKTTDGFTFTARKFGTQETMKVATDFVPNTFTVTIENDYSAVILLAIELVVGSVLVFFFYYRWRVKAHRQQKFYKHSPVPLKHLPPKNISVAEAAIIYRKKPKTSYVATLLEMTVAGKITVRSLGDEWDVVLRVAPSSLPRPELESLHILANRRPLLRGAEIPIERHTANRDLAVHALQYQDAAHDMLVKKGYLKPQKSRRKISAFGIILICIAVWAALSIYSLVGDRAFDKLQPSGNTVHIGGPGLDFVCIFLLIAIIAAIIYFHRRTKTYQKYTLKGIRLALYLDGLEKFLQLPESDRLSFLNSTKKADTSLAGLVQLFEQLLPWASLFSVEKSWVSDLTKYYKSLKSQQASLKKQANSLGDNSDLTPDSIEISTSVVDGLNLANLASQINSSMEQSTYYANRSNKD